MDLNDFSTFDLLSLLSRGVDSPFTRERGDDVLSCRVWTSRWIPDGLTLQGYPEAEDRLRALDDFPYFTLEFSCPIQSGVHGVETLDLAVLTLKRASDEIRQRSKDVELELLDIQASMREPAKPWHLIDLDPVKQVLRTSQSRLDICFQRDQSKQYLSCADVSRFVDRPSRRLGKPMKWKGAYVDQIDRGGHCIRIMRPRFKPISADLRSPVRQPFGASSAS